MAVTDPTHESFYDQALYYDIAFDWDVGGDLDVLERAFTEHGQGTMRRVLEPACGTGRMLRALTGRGIEAVGYDLNAKMVAFTRDHAGAGATVVQADMADAAFAPVFDAAICPINSLGHLVEDHDIVAHLRATGESLRPGGIYMVQLSSVYEDLSEFDPEQWTAQRDGVSIDITWRIVSEDIATRRSVNHSTLIVNDHGVGRVFEEDHVMRVWTYGDIRRLVDASERFTLACIYDEEGEPLPPNTAITGETGNLYYVFKRV